MDEGWIKDCAWCKQECGHKKKLIEAMKDMVGPVKNRLFFVFWSERCFGCVYYKKQDLLIK